MSHNIPPLEYDIPGYHNVDARIHRDNFRVQGNVQIAGDLVPNNGELSLGSDEHRFTTIYLHALSGNIPSIHFGDHVFTGQDVLNAQKAANALFPFDPWDGSGGVNWWTEIEPVGHPTTLSGYGITDAATDAQGARADSVFYSVLPVSSNWDSTYGSVLATSGNWDTVYANVYDTVTELNGLDVSTDLNVGGGITITGYISAGDRILGPANMVIDPAAHQDNTGKLSILGDLQVGGTTTTVNQLSSNNIKSSGNLLTNTLDVTDTITIGGRIHGPAEMYIDPAAIGDNTGKLIVLGDLQVDGTTTTVNSTTVTVSGKTLVLAEGSADAAQADNSGIQIQGPDAIFKYFAADDRWKSNRQVKISRSSPALVFDKTDNGRSSVLAHDANGLYFKVTDNGDTTRFMNAGNGTNLLINHNTHRVGINTTTPSVALHVNDTDAIKIPKGTTAERPSATTATHQGYIRYNTTTNQFEGFGAGNSWGSLGGVMDVDQDTYISPESSPGADDDTLKFFTGGLERARIDSSGKVGIGTNAAQQRLHVYHDPMRVSHNIGANTAYTFLNFASDRTIDDYGGVNSVYWRVNLQTPSNDHRRGDLRFGAKTNVSDSTIVDRVTFTYDGKVGIGTSYPDSTLTVDGNISIWNGNRFWLKDGADIGIENDAGDNAFYIKNVGAAGSSVLDLGSGKMVVEETSGYVGIGTTNPVRLLHVNSGVDNMAARFTSTDTAVQIELEDLTGRGWIEARNDFRFGNNQKELMRIDAAGNIGIGTTAPQSPIHIIHQSDDRSVKNGFKLDRAFTPVAANTTQTRYEKGMYITASWCDIPADSVENGYRIAVDGSCYMADTNFKGYLESNMGVWARAGAYTNSNDLANQNPTGTINNSYAVYADCLQSDNVTINNSYGIYQRAGYTNDPDDSKNFFHSRVGIGIEDPEEKLHVKGGRIKVTSDGSDNSGAVLELNHANNNTTDVCSTVNFTNNVGTFAKIVGGTADGNNNGYISFQTDDNGASAERMRIDNKGNVRFFDQAGIMTFNDTIAPAGSTTVFNIDGGHGAMAFRINFVMNGTSGESVAKTYEVVKQFAKQPIFFKVIDTGPYSPTTPDLDVNFTQGTNNYQLVCTVTNTHSTQDVQIVTTMWLAGSPTDLNVTEF